MEHIVRDKKSFINLFKSIRFVVRVFRQRQQQQIQNLKNSREKYVSQY
jgi:hypothetical protein